MANAVIALQAIQTKGSSTDKSSAGAGTKCFK